MIRSVCFALAFAVACTSHGQQVFDRVHVVGEAIKLTSSEPVGWDIESSLKWAIKGETSDDFRAFYVGSGPLPGNFRVKAWANHNVQSGDKVVAVPTVKAVYNITVKAYVPPDGPVNPVNPDDPPAPAVVPSNVPSKWGLGPMVWQQSRALNDRDPAVYLAKVFEKAADSAADAVAKGKNTSEEAPKVGLALQKYITDECHRTFPSRPKWFPFLDQLGQKLDTAAPLVDGKHQWSLTELEAAYREVAAALRIAYP
jgi:hypothetical protein